MNTATLRVLHFGAFVVPLAVYTYLLLVPNPVPPISSDVDLMFLVNKAAHVGGYAFLTAVGFLFPRVGRHRWAVVGFMMLHGIGTEIGQTYVPNRHGCIQDVLIDWTGIAVGQYVARRISRRTGAENRPATSQTGSHFPAAGPE